MNLEHFKTELLSSKEKLAREIAHYEKEDPYKSSLRSTEVLDDTITEIEEHDRLLATSAELKKDLQEIEKALSRMELGTFGICVSCGNQIEEERLEVLPTATMCLSCQKKLKR